MKDTEHIKKIYANIKSFRELKHITREQMASDLNMSLSGYAKIERGEVDVPISRLYEIAQILEVDVQQILDFDVAQVFNYGATINYNDGYIQTHSANPKMTIQSDAYFILL